MCADLKYKKKNLIDIKFSNRELGPVFQTHSLAAEALWRVAEFLMPTFGFFHSLPSGLFVNSIHALLMSLSPPSAAAHQRGG